MPYPGFHVVSSDLPASKGYVVNQGSLPTGAPQLIRKFRTPVLQPSLLRQPADPEANRARIFSYQFGGITQFC